MVFIRRFVGKDWCCRGKTSDIAIHGNPGSLDDIIERAQSSWELARTGAPLPLVRQSVSAGRAGRTAVVLDYVCPLAASGYTRILLWQRWVWTSIGCYVRE